VGVMILGFALELIWLEIYLGVSETGVKRQVI